MFKIYIFVSMLICIRFWTKMSITLYYTLFTHLKVCEVPQKSYPTEFVNSTQNHHKIVVLSNQSTRMKVFPKKSIFKYLVLP
jgi:hypothetical protein